MFIITLKLPLWDENVVIIDVCRHKTDMIADTRSKTFAAERRGLPIRRNLTRFTADIDTE